MSRGHRHRTSDRHQRRLQFARISTLSRDRRARDRRYRNACEAGWPRELRARRRCNDRGAEVGPEAERPPNAGYQALGDAWWCRS